MHRPLQYIVLFFACLALSGQALAAAVGEVEELEGTVEARLADEPVRTLAVGDPVFVGDHITTMDKSRVKLRFQDDTTFELGPDSVFEITEYAFQRDADTDAFAGRMLRGTFRFVTGLVARQKPEAFSVTATVATIGIRGTHVVGEVEATRAVIILMDPIDDDPGRIEVFNEFGTVMIDQPGWGTEIPDEFSPPSPPRRMRLETIQNVTRGLQRIQRMPMPRPRMR